jgi:hypothetical protein
MFEKILIANRGDQLPQGGAATKSNHPAAKSCKGAFAAGAPHV